MNLHDLIGAIIGTGFLLCMPLLAILGALLHLAEVIRESKETK